MADFDAVEGVGAVELVTVVFVAVAVVVAAEGVIVAVGFVGNAVVGEYFGVQFAFASEEEVQIADLLNVHVDSLEQVLEY